MCGIAGFVRPGGLGEHASGLLRAMLSQISHRGPDDQGVWIDSEKGIAIGHRRLSIIDTSVSGQQPMVSSSGRYVIAFNGEIYNFRELKSDLELRAPNIEWKSRSDTEVLLETIDAFGLEDSLRKVNGMFAFSLWDRKEQLFSIARDRMGEKPLYYGYFGDSLVYGSELKAIRKHENWQSNISRESICKLLRHNYIPAPNTIYKEVYKLEPGSFISYSKEVIKRRQHPEGIRYWDLDRVVSIGAREQYSGDFTDAVSDLDRLVRDSVARQMVSDVPLGAFLSGGIDSTTIVAFMQELSSIPIKTFTIGFNEEGYNEAEHAKELAKYLGTEHTELYVTPKQCIDVIPKLPVIYDEPFSDVSQIPTYLVSRLAKKNVTVSLSGDGGDELFGGYNRYIWSESIWRKLSFIPLPVRKIAARMLLGAGRGKIASAVEFVNTRTIRSKSLYQYRDKSQKLAEIMTVNGPEEIFYSLVSHWKKPTQVVVGAEEQIDEKYYFSDKNLSILGNMTKIDMKTYLPNDILTKVDRATMAVSLEARVPFLDPSIIEFASTLPDSYKVDKGRGKRVLREVLYKKVPRYLVDRPKMGFGVPIGDWLRGELREWADSLLNPERIKREGYFQPEQVKDAWDAHLCGKRNMQYNLWDILVFQAWLESQN